MAVNLYLFVFSKIRLWGIPVAITYFKKLEVMIHFHRDYVYMCNIFRAWKLVEEVLTG